MDSGALYCFLKKNSCIANVANGYSYVVDCLNQPETAEAILQNTISFFERTPSDNYARDCRIGMLRLTLLDSYTSRSRFAEALRLAESIVSQIVDSRLLKEITIYCKKIKKESIFVADLKVTIALCQINLDPSSSSAPGYPSPKRKQLERAEKLLTEALATYDNDLSEEEKNSIEMNHHISFCKKLLNTVEYNKKIKEQGSMKTVFRQIFGLSRKISQSDAEKTDSAFETIDARFKSWDKKKIEIK